MKIKEKGEWSIYKERESSFQNNDLNENYEETLINQQENSENGNKNSAYDERNVMTFRKMKTFLVLMISLLFIFSKINNYEKNKDLLKSIVQTINNTNLRKRYLHNICNAN